MANKKPIKQKAPKTNTKTPPPELSDLAKKMVGGLEDNSADPSQAFKKNPKRGKPVADPATQTVVPAVPMPEQPTTDPIQPVPAIPAIPPRPVLSKVRLSDPAVEYYTFVLREGFGQDDETIDQRLVSLGMHIQTVQKTWLGALMLRVSKLTGGDQKFIPPEGVYNEANFNKKLKYSDFIKQNFGGQPTTTTTPPPEDAEERREHISGMFSRWKKSAISYTKGSVAGQGKQLGQLLKFSTLSALSGKSVDDYFIEARRKERIEAAEKAVSAPTTTASVDHGVRGSSYPTGISPTVIVKGGGRTAEEKEEDADFRARLLEKLDMIYQKIGGKVEDRPDDKDKGSLLKTILGWGLAIGGVVSLFLNFAKSIPEMILGLSSKLFSSVSGAVVDSLKWVGGKAVSILSDLFNGIVNGIYKIFPSMKPSAAPPITPTTPDIDRERVDPITGEKSSQTSKAPDKEMPKTSKAKTALRAGLGVAAKVATVAGGILSGPVGWALLAGGVAYETYNFVVDRWENSPEGRAVKAEDDEYNDNYNRIIDNYRKTGEISVEDYAYLSAKTDGTGNRPYPPEDAKIIRGGKRLSVESTSTVEPSPVAPVARVGNSGEVVRENGRIAAELAVVEKKQDQVMMSNTTNNNVGPTQTKIMPVNLAPTDRRNDPFGSMFKYG